MAEKFLFDNVETAISVFTSSATLFTIPAGEFWYVKEWAWFLDGPTPVPPFPPIGSLTFEIRVNLGVAGDIFTLRETIANKAEGGRLNRSTILQPTSIIKYVRIAAPIAGGFLRFKLSAIRRQP